MNFSQLIEIRQATEEQIQKLLTKFDTTVAHGFGSAMADFFARRPEIIGIKWSQYTPYFNDGDPCVFGVGEVFYFTKKLLEESGVDSLCDVDPYAGGYIGYELKEENPDLYYDLREVEDFVEGLGDTAMRLWGDHACVTVDPSGITVEDYEHD